MLEEYRASKKALTEFCWLLNCFRRRVKGYSDRLNVFRTIELVALGCTSLFTTRGSSDYMAVLSLKLLLDLADFVLYIGEEISDFAATSFTPVRRK